MKDVLKSYPTVSDKMKTEEAIELVKLTFIKHLSNMLNLKKVSAPVVVLKGTGINDDLNGMERPVGFPIKDLAERRAEVVHSLAKWKRLRLKQYEIPEGEGIVTDMRALRPDEKLSPLHSIYVDQFDWEQHIPKTARTVEQLKTTVQKIYAALKATEAKVHEVYPEVLPTLPAEITFIHSEDLLMKYPQLTPKEREDAAAKEYGAFFLMGIGGKLFNGEKHDGRAPDYDDWSTLTQKGQRGLNGDIIVWNSVLGRSFELSSMGIRVDEEALLRQLELEDSLDRKELYFHQLLLSGALPQSIGGGIGQSRLAMLLLKKRHIGEVQVSIWSDAIYESTAEKGIQLL
ncbi:aspartate--ammonia ligase [Aureispira anguillae]|uniref:Aspartate--ammonia ligase n=1 Tax=Aureispira anguillae TaxID=2864201 RepID=A0A915Y9P5_9BACT|nr:aspartate--ammonia ligase [Aureispira anguillae]BDS09668.1 aspartate--ammonia ligase [Aureispira anguillae]